MNGNFKKIKRRALIVRLLKSLFTGAAVALPVIGALLMFARFEMIALERTPILLIGCGAGLVISVLVFLLLRRNDKRIAMLLDRKYRLNEKVQTMLAYKNREGEPMIDLQRKDADQALESAKRSVIGIGRMWIYVLLLLIGAALFTLSLFFHPVPPPEPEPEPPVPYEVSEIQLAALAELIESVAASEMESPYRENVVAALQTLDSEIREITTLVEKDEVVLRAIDEIMLQTDNSSVAVELIDALWSTGGKNARQLAKLMNYYDWPKSDEWDYFNGKKDDFYISFEHIDATSEHPDYELMTEETQSLYLLLAEAIERTLKQVGAAETDALTVVLTRLASANESNADKTHVYGLTTLAEYIVANTYKAAQRELESTLTALGGELFRVLSQNKVNINTGENAVTVLAGLFDVAAPRFERPQMIESSTGSDTGSGEGGVSGGISGGPTYGSDDKIYDPFTNRYVEYGTILDKYYAIMFGNITDGNYTEQEKKALEEYFKILYGGFETEGDQNQ